ncbi:Hypothetical predicted protein [Pelobates cultripes]|uniref:Uncharacterized protein n=1 Tax=Pelobates cultripes TaxID=61616 RepID=A0AAD1SV08_PELCU|nr:Hypothetical predicted protein [Pelobates cultripes]
MTNKVIGIFSRESDDTYKWLSDYLQSLPRVREVNKIYIGNNSSQMFNEGLHSSHFAILYHSKNRGRINITDVTDSLYDKELEKLSNKLGKKRVIVVVDNLEDSSNAKKTLILEKQPTIARLATELFLFSTEEMATFDKESPSQHSSSPRAQKLLNMEEIIFGKAPKMSTKHKNNMDTPKHSKKVKGRSKKKTSMVTPKHGEEVKRDTEEDTDRVGVPSASDVSKASKMSTKHKNNMDTPKHSKKIKGKTKGSKSTFCGCTIS